MSLPDRPRAVVTGAGGGLGRALCLELARRRGRVIAADIDLAAAELTAAAVRDAGGEAHAVACDVAQLAQVERLVEEAGAAFGGADLVVNNAGVAASGPMAEIPMADWDWIVGINLMGFAKTEDLVAHLQKIRELILTTHRPVVLYLMGNQFAAAPAGSTLPSSSYAAFADLTIPKEHYFVDSINAWTLETDQALEVNRVRFTGLQTVGHWYVALPEALKESIVAVSYTHLTLPTSDLV